MLWPRPIAVPFITLSLVATSRESKKTSPVPVKGRVRQDPSHPTNAMATSVKFMSFRPITIGNLRPTPNVTEWEAIRACLDADKTPRLEHTPEALKGKELKIITSYRSSLLWLAGGVVICRHSPKTDGGHGYAGWPPVGLKEDVIVGNDWVAEVEFV